MNCNTCCFLRRLLFELGFKPFSQRVIVWTWIQTFFSEGYYLNLDSNLFFLRRLLSELGFKPAFFSEGYYLNLDSNQFFSQKVTIWTWIHSCFFLSQKVTIWTWIQTCFFSEGYYLNLDSNLFFSQKVTVWIWIQTCFLSGYYLNEDSNVFFLRLLFELGFKLVFSQKVTIWTWIQTCILMMLKPCYCDLAMLPPPDVVTCFIHTTQFCLFKNSFSLCRWDLETMTKNNTISRALNNGWCDCFWAKCMFVCLLKTGKRKKKKKKKLIKKKESKKLSTETALDRWKDPEGDTDWPV